jgi:hypothetical protein
MQGFNPTRFGRALYSRGAFANYAERYAAEGDNRMAAAASGKKRLPRGFQVSDAMVNDFRSYLQSEKVRIDDASFAKDIDFIKAMIHYEIDVALFGIGEAQKNLIAHDPQAQFALAQFGDAVKLTELTKARVNTKGGN